MPKTQSRKPPYKVRTSRIHGKGVFATRAIRRGAHVGEYIGERISHKEAERRYSTKDSDDGHTFLFTVDSKVVVDAGVGGDATRFINHSCDPNCEVEIDEDDRIQIDAIKSIAIGDELSYDYNIGRSRNDPPDVEEVFACHCGAANCRGNMLAPRKKPRRKSKTSRARKKKSAKR